MNGLKINDEGILNIDDSWSLYDYFLNNSLHFDIFFLFSQFLKKFKIHVCLFFLFQDNATLF